MPAFHPACSSEKCSPHISSQRCKYGPICHGVRETLAVARMSVHRGLVSQLGSRWTTTVTMQLPRRLGLTPGHTLARNGNTHPQTASCREFNSFIHSSPKLEHPKSPPKDSRHIAADSHHRAALGNNHKGMIIGNILCSKYIQHEPGCTLWFHL